jgi:glyoxylase-like metal-dependent hydrolase (beta-lactamase superfamily II)
VRQSWRSSRRTCKRTTRSGLPELVARSGATVYLPTGAGVEFEHVALADGDVIELGNTLVTAIATPGHAPAHHAYTVADRRRGTEEPWLVFSGDSLLIGDVGRPDLHVAGDARGQALLLHTSLKRLLELPDHVVLYPSHYAGSVCGRGLSGNPVSSIGFERVHNPMLALADPEAFADALVADMPPRPAEQERIVAANRAGTAGARV